MRKDILERKDEIVGWISDNKTKSFICKQLKCKQSTLNLYLNKMGIDYAGNQGGIGVNKVYSHYKTAKEYANSTYVKSSKLKDKLIKEGLKKDRCEICGVSTWFEDKLVLELYHKNRNHYDNDLNNLQILCPNCHSVQKSHEQSRLIYNKK